MNFRKPNSRSFLFIILFLLSVCTSSYAQLQELIPTENFFGGNRYNSHKISPDGKYISYFGPSKEGGYYFWLQTPGSDEKQMITDFPTGMFGYQWAYDNKHLIYMRDIDGDENFHFYSYNIETKNVKVLTPYTGVKGQNLLMEPDCPDEILVGLNYRDKRLFDIHRINLETGEISLDTENPGDVRWWLADHDLKVRAAVALNQDNGSTILRIRDTEGSPWRDLIVWPFGETGMLEGYGSEIAVAFTADGNSMYVQSAFGENTTRLAKVDTKTGDILEIVASDPKMCLWNVTGATLYDKLQVLFEPGTMEVQALGFEYFKPEWRAVKSEFRSDFRIFSDTHDGVFNIVDRDLSGRHWLVQYYNDHKPGAVFYYDRNSKKMTQLFRTNTHLDNYTFAPMEPVEITARDGLKIPCYLTLPVGIEHKNLPLVMNIHGGPWARDDWGYKMTTQWLANRGYAVMQVNYRGSTGFGKEFMNAGTGEWGVGGMQNDITDAVKWAVDQGIADPDRVGIWGTSYGGFAVLAGLTFTPDVYKCGIDVCGPANVNTFIDSFPDWWGPIKKRWLLRIGGDINVLEDEEFSRKISPFYHIDKITAQLMIVHGVNDPRVAISESDQIVNTMRKNDLDVTYIVFPDEGHGVGKYANYVDYLGRVEKFLAENLGGRCAPYQQIYGSTAEIR